MQDPPLAVRRTVRPIGIQTRLPLGEARGPACWIPASRCLSLYATLR